MPRRCLQGIHYHQGSKMTQLPLTCAGQSSLDHTCLLSHRGQRQVGSSTNHLYDHYISCESTLCSELKSRLLNISLVLPMFTSMPLAAMCYFQSFNFSNSSSRDSAMISGVLLSIIFLIFSYLGINNNIWHNFRF